MKNLFLLVISVFYWIGIFAQAPQIEWQKSFGGCCGEEARSVQQTTDGGYIVAGISESNNGDITGNHGSWDVWVLKLNSTGNLEWQKSYGGMGIDGAYSIQQTVDGGYIAAGMSSMNSGDVTEHYGSTDFWIVKLNIAGDVEWQKSYGGTFWDVAYSIQQTTDGGYIVAGISDSNDGDITESNGASEFWVLKLNNIGNLEWQKCYGGSHYEIAYSIQQTIDGGYIIAGSSTSNDGDVTENYGSADCWVVKLNNFGNLEWQKSYGGSGSDVAHSIQQTIDGGYIIAGSTSSNDGDVTENYGDKDFWVIKLNNAGDMEWQKSYGGSDFDEAYSIQQTTDGGYIVAGTSFSENGDVIENHGSGDYWIIKINDVGNIEWQKSLGGSDSDYCYAIQQTTYGGYIAVGASYSSDGDVAVNHGVEDFWVVKLSGIGTQVSDIIKNPDFSIYPNPVSDALQITGWNTEKQVIIKNTIGQTVLKKSVKNNQEKIDVSGLPAGMYFINGQKFVKK